MLYYNQYVRAESLDEAYDLYQSGRYALAENEK